MCDLYFETANCSVSIFIYFIALFKKKNSTYRAVKSKREEHHEEYDGPEGGCWQGGDGLRVHHEH